MSVLCGTDYFMHPPTIDGGDNDMFSGCPRLPACVCESVRPSVNSPTRYYTNRSEELHQIYSCGAFGNTDQIMIIIIIPRQSDLQHGRPVTYKHAIKQY